jgi:hypothetical protein
MAVAGRARTAFDRGVRRDRIGPRIALVRVGERDGRTRGLARSYGMPIGPPFHVPEPKSALRPALDPMLATHADCGHGQRRDVGVPASFDGVNGHAGAPGRVRGRASRGATRPESGARLQEARGEIIRRTLGSVLGAGITEMTPTRELDASAPAYERRRSGAQRRPSSSVSSVAGCGRLMR